MKCDGSRVRACDRTCDAGTESVTCMHWLSLCLSVAGVVCARGDVLCAGLAAACVARQTARQPGFVCVHGT